MADHAEPEYSTATGNDYRQHEDMYEAFLKITKWGIISVVLVLVFLFAFVWS
jgi:Bacterial aa3 type cytochrome c oxidase subunit IV